MTKKIKNYLKVISIILTFAIILQSIPIAVSAQSMLDVLTETQPETTVAEDATIVEEDISLREENKKYFLMSDDTYLMAMYNTPVHYLENGQWVDIDNSLYEDSDSEGDTVLKNKKSNFDIKFSKKAKKNKLVSIKKDGYKLDWSLESAKKVSAKTFSADGQEDEKTHLKNINGTVVYEDVLNNTDLTYTVTPTSIKEYLVVKNINAPRSYTFTYNLNKLSWRENDSGDIELYDATQPDNSVYVIEKAYMYDSAGEYSDNVTMDVSSENDSLILTLTPDKEWLNAEEREFPVTIDPSVLLNFTVKNIKDTTVSFTTKANTAYSTLVNEVDSLKVGKRGGIELATVMYADICSDMPENSTLISANFSMCYYRYSLSTCSTNLQLNAYKITSDWNQTNIVEDIPLCTDTSPATPSYDSTVIDFAIANDSNSSSHGVRTSWDITKAVKQWLDGETNYGIMIRGTGLPSSERYARFFSSDSSVANSDPAFVVQYVDNRGLEDYWTYTPMNAGRYGTAYVNNHNGNVVVTQHDCGIGGNLMPVSISHVYNSGNSFVNLYGGKWRLNYQMSITASDITNYPYYFTDSDGTNHYFYQASSDAAIKDEDGLGYTLTVNTADSNAYYTIMDKDKGKMIFNSSGNLVKIMDAVGNAATVQYTYGNISTITDGAGRVYTLTYSNGFLSSITAPDSKVTQYLYNNSNELQYIKYPDGKSTIISYNGGNIALVTDPDGKTTSLTYTNSTPKRLSDISRKTADDEIIESYSFSYQHNATDITDNLDRKYTYQFNNYGQTTGILNWQGNQSQSYSYGAPDTSGGTRNKLLSESQVQKSVINLLKNHRLDSNLTGFNTSYDGQQVVSFSWDGTKGNIADGCIKVDRSSIVSSTNPYVYVWQQYTVPVEGYYTFSGYINTGSAQFSDRGAVVRLERWSSAGTPVNGVHASVNHTESDEWVYCSATNYFEAGDNIRCLVGTFDYTSMSPMWFDDLQLEYSPVANSYNTLQNTDFNNSLTDWSVTGTASNVSITDSDKPQSCSKGISISGKNSISRATQTMDVSGKIGDVFSLGCWAKASSVPTDTAYNSSDTARTFGIRIDFYKNGAIKGYRRIPYNFAYNGWQFVSGEAIAPSDYDQVKIHLEYNYNANTAVFTLPYCYKESYGQSYTYDDNGNIISSKDLTESQTEFSYTNNQLSKVFNPSGSNYSYTYNKTTNKLQYAVSTDGVLEEIQYDSVGNPISATTWKMKPVTQIESGKTYAIINAKTRNALDCASNTMRSQVHNYAFYKYNTYQKWTVTAIGNDLYRFNIYPDGDDTTFRLDVAGNSSADNATIFLYNELESIAQKYKLQYNNDGTFTILTAASNFTKCVDAQPGDVDDNSNGVKILQYTYTAGDEAQKWYFYEMDITEENSANIKTSATYSEDKNYLATVTDAVGNATNYNYNTTNGLLNSVTDPMGNTTQYTYYPNNQLETVTSGGITGTYTYQNEYLIGINISNGTSYTIDYDSYGRTTSTSVGDTALSTLEYNSQGLISKQTYGNGNYIAFSYDSLDRITEKVYNGDESKKISYYYDTRSRIGMVSDSVQGVGIRYIYDLSGRLVKQDVYSDISPTSNKIIRSVKYIYQDKTNYITKVEYSSELGIQTYEYTYGDTDNLTMPDAVYSVKNNETTHLQYVYDDLGRLSTRTISPINKVQTYNYLASTVDTNSTTTLVESVVSDGVTYSYTYDANGNITQIKKNGELYESYEYDALSQLTKVTTANGDVYTYTYSNGNILSVSKNGTVEKSYGYADTNWADLLTSYNGTAITYDAIGNPNNWRNNMSFTWSNGRQLTGITKGTDNIAYTYNADGLRTSKTVNGTTTEYYWIDGILQGQKTGSEYIVFLYDENGTAYGILVNDGTNSQYYYYQFNLQGDVIGIYDSTGTTVVQYTYDAWGKVLSVTGSQANTIGQLNPYRYRGYYYDVETGFYLTGTRYYDPEIGRFINADGQINDDILGTNLFAYCGNNPVTRADDTGRGWWVVAGALIGGIAGGVTKIVSNVTTGKKWNEGVIGATVGGAVYGGVLAATGNVWAAGFASAAAESLTNEVVSYIPKVSQANGQTVTKKVTTGNVIDSTKTVLNDTAVNGTISAVTGKIAGKIVPTNNGWFKPQKFVSSFAGKYAIKSELQTLTQSGLLFGVEGLKYSFNQRLKQGQQPIVTFFPDTEIRAAG